MSADRRKKSTKSPEYQEAVSLVAQGALLELTWSQLAERVGVARQTLYVWSKDPGFWDDVRAAMPRELQSAVPEAIAAIRREMKRGKGVNAIKAAELLLRAAGVILDRSEQRTETVVAQLTPDTVAELDKVLDGILAEALPPAKPDIQAEPI